VPLKINTDANQSKTLVLSGAAFAPLFPGDLDHEIIDIKNRNLKKQIHRSGVMQKERQKA